MTRAGGWAALIPAAGGGERLGRGPKAVLRLGGRTLVEHVASRLRSVVDEVWLGVPEGVSLPPLPGVRMVPGGTDRQGTVRALLAATERPWVLVHDVARPLAPAALHAAVAAVAEREGAATAALPVADTLHDVARDVPVDRTPLRAVQTPQAFRRAWLCEAHERARRDGWHATDDAQLVRRCGHPVALVPGSPWAWKLTGPEDWDVLSCLAASAGAP